MRFLFWFLLLAVAAVVVALAVKLNNGSSWKLQMEWSNAAFNAGSGFPNTSGHKGCLQGN